jgi:membrane-associated phospholipid phosphatase
MTHARASDRNRSLPVVVQRPAFAVVILSVLVVLFLGMRYAGESSASWLDRIARTRAQEWFPVPVDLAQSFIALADPLPFAVLVALLTVTCFVTGRRRLAVLAVAGPVVTGLATTVLKPVIERTKDGDLVFPSGHMGAATALALVAGLLVASLTNATLRVAVVAVTALTASVSGAMAVAMTVTNYHYLTDAVGGFCVAVSVVLGLALLLDRWLGVRAPKMDDARNAPPT